MDELMMLREAFGPDEVPTEDARSRSRSALLERGASAPTSGLEALFERGTPVSPGVREGLFERRASASAGGLFARPASALASAGGLFARRDRSGRRSRRPLWIGLTAAAVIAAFATFSPFNSSDAPVRHSQSRIVADPGTAVPRPAVLPFAHPANAVEYLENAAWTADGTTAWTNPRPDQFMYRESKVLHNNKELEDASPNGPLVPGRSTVVLEQRWNRIDGQVMAYMNNGKLIVEQKGPRGGGWDQVPYSELVGLTTPEKVIAWEDGPHPIIGLTLPALVSQYVLPPNVQAAVFRAIARGDGVRLDPDTVNLDGRPAIGLGMTIEGYLSQELLFDKATYTLIGERLVAIADHRNGTVVAHKGDVFRQATYTAALIVDSAGATR